MPRLTKILQYSVTSLAFLLLAYSIASTQIYFVKATDTGLASRMPMTFWFGLAVLGLVWFVCKKSSRGLAVALALTIGYLFVAPAVIRVPVWLSNSYYPFGESALINSSGHLVDYPSTTLNSYHYWPSFLYFSSVFVQITGIPDSIIMKYFPLLIMALFGVLVFLILRVKLKASYAIFGAAWLVSSFWLRQQYFGPPAFGYVFFLLNLLLLSKLFFTETTKKKELAALFFISFIVVTLTHVLSAFMSIAALVALYLSHRLAHRRASNVVATLTLSSIAAFLSYNMFSAPGFFNLASLTFYRIFSFNLELGIFKEPSRVSGSAAQVLNYRSTLAMMLVCGAIAVIPMLLLLKNRLSRKRLSISGYDIFWMIFLLFLGLFAVGAEYGAHEAYQRAFMFGLVPLSYFCVSLLSRKPKVLIVALSILFFLNIPAQYGADSYTLARNPQLSGSKFVAIYTPQNITCFYDFSLEIRYYNPQKQIKFLILASLPFTDVPNASTVNKVLNEADYMIVSDQEINFYYYFLKQSPLDQARAIAALNSLNRLYDASSFQLLRRANETSVP